MLSDPRCRHAVSRVYLRLRAVAAIIVNKQRKEAHSPGVCTDDISEAEDSEEELERALVTGERDKKSGIGRDSSGLECTSGSGT